MIETFAETSMPPQTKNNAELQRVVDQLEPMGTLTLRPPRGEFQGPVVIRRPLTIQGQGGTIWCPVGPVLVVEADGVELQDVNIEITSNEHDLDGERGCALVVKGGHSPHLHSVSVRGNVSGMQTEEGDWWYPRSIRLGKPIAGQSHEFKVRIVVPVPCKFRSEIDGLSVSPSGVKAGPCEVTVHLEPLAAGTRLRGTLAICSAFLTRRVAVTAVATRNATDRGDVGKGQVIWEPADWAALTSASSPSLPTERKDSKNSTQQPPQEAGERAKQGPKKKRQASVNPKSEGKSKSIPTKLPTETAPTTHQRPEIPAGFSANSAEPKDEGSESTSHNKPQKALTPPSPKVTSIPLGGAWSATTSHSETRDLDTHATSPREHESFDDANDTEEAESTRQETVSAEETTLIAQRPIKKRKSTPLSGVFGSVQESDVGSKEVDEPCSESQGHTIEQANAEDETEATSKRRRMVKPKSGVGFFAENKGDDE